MRTAKQVASGPVLEMVVDLAVRPMLSTHPDGLEALLALVLQRTEAVLASVLSRSDHLRDSRLILPAPEDVPFFPVAWLGRRFRGCTDLELAIERHARANGLPRRGVDALGKAVSWSVWASAERVREEDRRPGEIWTIDPQDHPPAAPPGED